MDGNTVDCWPMDATEICWPMNATEICSSLCSFSQFCECTIDALFIRKNLISYEMRIFKESRSTVMLSLVVSNSLQIKVVFLPEQPVTLNCMNSF